MNSIVSYTLPCHKRADDLAACMPSVIAAANAAPPVEIIVVDYGHPGTLVPFVWDAARRCEEGVTIRTVRVEREHFHMAHARNVGIKAASGSLVVAFLADMTVTSTFFAYLRNALAPGTFMKWQETFAFWTRDIVTAGGFDERFEFYGPEGKELTDRLQRANMTERNFPDGMVKQIRTPNAEKTRNYRLPLTKMEMHLLGMEVWKDNQVNRVTVANAGQQWGAIA